MWAALAAMAALALAVLNWLSKRSDAKIKEKEATNAQIDALNNADDITRMGDKLRR